MIAPIGATFPPNDVASEGELLKIGYLDSRLVFDRLKPQYFYSEANRRVCEAQLAAHALRAPADARDVARWLRAHGRDAQVGGAPYLFVLIETVNVRLDLVDHYVERVVDTWRARTLAWNFERAAARLRLGGHWERVLALLERENEGVAA